MHERESGVRLRQLPPRRNRLRVAIQRHHTAGWRQARKQLARVAAASEGCI